MITLTDTALARIIFQCLNKWLASYLKTFERINNLFKFTATNTNRFVPWWTCRISVLLHHVGLNLILIRCLVCNWLLFRRIRICYTLTPFPFNGKTLLQIWGNLSIFKRVGFCGLELDLLVPYLPFHWPELLCLSSMEKPHKERFMFYFWNFTGRCRCNS